MPAVTDGEEGGGDDHMWCFGGCKGEGGLEGRESDGSAGVGEVTARLVEESMVKRPPARPCQSGRVWDEVRDVTHTNRNQAFVDRKVLDAFNASV